MIESEAWMLCVFMCMCMCVLRDEEGVAVFTTCMECMECADHEIK